MKQLHGRHVLYPKKITEQMENLKGGDMWGIYVRAQNCAIFVHTEDGEVTLSTFPASHQNEFI